MFKEQIKITAQHIECDCALNQSFLQSVDAEFDALQVARDSRLTSVNLSDLENIKPEGFNYWAGSVSETGSKHAIE